MGIDQAKRFTEEKKGDLKVNTPREPTITECDNTK